MADTIVTQGDYEFRAEHPNIYKKYLRTGGWNYIVLQNDIAYSDNNPALELAGFNFETKAGKRYEIEAKILLSSTAANTGARIGVIYPTILSAAIMIKSPRTAAADTQRHLTSSNDYNRVNATPTANEPYLTFMDGLLLAGDSDGVFQVTLQSETNGVEVAILAGSILKYREY